MFDVVLDWFASKGITSQTVEDFGVYVEDDGAVCFPYGNMVKKRYGIPTGERAFRWERGVDPVLFNRRDLGKGNLFLCEGETDTMRLRQEIGENEDVGVVGLPGIETWNSGMADDLRSAERVWVVLDNDVDYQIASRVDECYRSIRFDLGRKAQRILLPRGSADICEFFADYSIDALRLLVDRQPRPGESRFRTLDLRKEPPPVEWVVENLICRGDIHLFIGEPGIGKSWLTMALAQAVADGRTLYLGRRVYTHGRVLYFDEENPEDLIFQRFKKLGLTESGAENIRFISNGGLRLDRNPDAIVDEALDYDPSLIILDSLTRFHTEDENSAGAMSRVFNEGIKPLARATGAAVVLIHHANKSEALSSFKRSRGSGDITASVDSGYDVKPVSKNTVSITNFKTRRVSQGEGLFVSIVDSSRGVELLGMSGYGDVF